MDREVYNAAEQLDSLRNIEIVSLEKILDEQNKMVHALKSEREAFERHSQLLEAQNRQLIEELDMQVKVSEHLQHTLDKRERVTELKEKMQFIRNEVLSKSPIRQPAQQAYVPGSVMQTAVSPLRFRK